MIKNFKEKESKNLQELNSIDNRKGYPLMSQYYQTSVTLQHNGSVIQWSFKVNNLILKRIRIGMKNV